MTVTKAIIRCNSKNIALITILLHFVYLRIFRISFNLLTYFVFFSLKRIYSLYIESLIWRYYIYIAKKNFLTGFYDVFKIVITSDNIKSGFVKINFVLFDFNTVFSEFEIPLVIFTPTISPLTSAGFIRSPSVKTLKNIKEVIR